jgi:hypothetical protein
MSINICIVNIDIDNVVIMCIKYNIFNIFIYIVIIFINVPRVFFVIKYKLKKSCVALGL